ncbi:outer membrane beta-barrel protein [Phocaeicola sp.]|uniref:outer membrane beta-barrel protein n=1 Tax=Phocaeicola sp. TaxID=2773926 RepID=UPI0023BF7EF7|nr:outer membrane beta-barrel protein [Phocaeicola sp.]MDE5677145.1 outer membrane beta-barrel protein [Phocaeicola sp.]
MNNKLLYLLASLLVSNAAMGQILKGKVTNEQGAPVEFANVVLLSLPDSAFVQGTISNQEGTFHISASEEKYLLRISCIGYTTLHKHCTAGDMGTLQLSADTQQLGEVVVKGDLPQTRLKDGARLTAVAGSILEKAGTAEDLLNRVPGLSADGGRVNVFGRGTAEVYINGRKVRDHTELDRLASDNIKSVEVVNNPGARYAASVKAVVRIVTKKAQGDGWGFNNRLVTKYRYDWSVLDQLNFNYRKNGFDLTGMLYGSDRKSESYKTVEQDTYLNQLWQQDSRYEDRSHKQLLSGMLSMNWQIEPERSLGVRYTYKRTPKERRNFDMATTLLQDGQWNEDAVNMNAGNEQNTDHRVNAYYYGKWKKWTVDFNADGIWNETSETERGREQVRGEDGNESNATITTLGNNKNALYAAKLMLSRGMAGGELSVGSEYSHNNRTNLYYNEEGILQNDDSEIREGIWGVFAEYSHPLGQGGVQAGVRYERMKSDYLLSGKKVDEQSRTYDNVFPSVSFFHPLGKTQLQLSYAADITRPNYSQLCGAITYLNRYTYESGNPLLQPMLRHNLTLDFSYAQLYLSLGYQHVRNEMVSYYDTYSPDEPAISLIYEKNIAAYDKVSALAVYSPKIGCWNPQFIAGVEQQWYTADTPRGVVV